MVVGVAKTVVTVRVAVASVAEAVVAEAAVDASDLFMSEVILSACARDVTVVDGVLGTVVIAGQTAGA